MTGPRVLCHFEDADGHVVVPAQVTLARDDSEFWGEPRHEDASTRPTRYGPCRVGLTFPIRRMKPKDAHWIQSAEIAHEVPCIFDSDGECVFGPCEKCGRRAPPGASAILEEEPV
jgi:hypothetical protein